VFSVAFGPLLAAKFWEKYSAYVLRFWTCLYLFWVSYFWGWPRVVEAIYEPLFADYLPFILLIFALYIVSGGIFVDFPRSYGPCFNTIYLFAGSILAGWMGTTGATSLLIRPFLRANSFRRYKTHLMVFFIFLVSNIGGAVTPLGDPPLFIGFLKGIDFFWFIKHLYVFIFGTIGALCLLFFAVDFYLFKKDGQKPGPRSNQDPSFILEGIPNIFLLVGILLTVILCNFPGDGFVLGESVSGAAVLRNLILLTIIIISVSVTPDEIYQRNGVSLGPIKEIGELFFGIFITIVPVIHIMNQGGDGRLGDVFSWIAPGGDFIASRCFWISGLLSSFLDNAPTFLLFFHMTSGDPNVLMTAQANILTAFSISTVFMGALTYIGNAPNLIVRSVAEGQGVAMPSFLGYVVWSMSILLPIFVIISYYL
jgi:Na+/H+ antiporter NhaD/arsenite permease-like protein